jgi:ubiquinone/menaquinone biosynthesis C-methylase UbiE
VTWGWRILGGAGVLGLAYFVEYFLERSRPRPFPYWMRVLILRPRPLLSPGRLLEILEPRPGEKILEIGPGTGAYTLVVAEALGQEGTLTALDVNQMMLDHVLREAAKNGIGNLVARRGDAVSLPFADASFDAAYLVTVLGEIHDEQGALAELRRVLKGRGRLVVAEHLFDPHWISPSTLRDTLGRAGFELERRLGRAGSYYALFRLRAPAL